MTLTQSGAQLGRLPWLPPSTTIMCLSISWAEMVWICHWGQQLHKKDIAASSTLSLHDNCNNCVLFQDGEIEATWVHRKERQVDLSNLNLWWNTNGIFLHPRIWQILQFKKTYVDNLGSWEAFKLHFFHSEYWLFSGDNLKSLAA